MVTAMPEQVVINTNTIKQLLNDPVARRKFPFLATAHKRMTSPPKASASRCAGCPRKKAGNSAEYAKLQRAIGMLPVDDKAKLKDHLGGGPVSVKYQVRKGKSCKVIF
jgi:hypothetical protein